MRGDEGANIERIAEIRRKEKFFIEN